ncbi:MAG: FtsB family cell division protein [Terriglobales bacterium]
MDIRINISKIRIVPSSEDRMRTLVQGADHAEAWAERARAHLAPLLETVYAVRRRAATGAVVVVAIWIFVHAMLGANGVTVYRAKRAEYQGLQTEINHLQKENDAYTQQVSELKSDPQRIEKEAREQFHYARPGEVVYVAPDRPVVAQPDTRSARR